MIHVYETTYFVDGCEEPCWEVWSEGFTVLVRIAKCYHYVGSDTLILSEYVDDVFNGEDEWTGDFDSLTSKAAVGLAKKFSAYLS